MSLALRRIGAALPTAAMLGVLLGCAADTPQADADPAGAVPPSATPEPRESPAPTIPDETPTIGLGEDGRFAYCDAQQTPFTGEPVKVFGADEVMAAYCDMVAFTLDESTWVPSLLTPRDSRTVRDFSTVHKYMTPSMQKWWDSAVRKALAAEDGTPADNDVQTLTLYNVDGRGIEVPDPVIVLNKKFSPGHAKVDRSNEAPRLAMTVTVNGDLRLREHGEPVVLPMEKKITYWLAPTGKKDRPWLIDGYKGNLSWDDFKPVR